MDGKRSVSKGLEGLGYSKRTNWKGRKYNGQFCVINYLFVRGQREGEGGVIKYVLTFDITSNMLVLQYAIYENTVMPKVNPDLCCNVWAQNAARRPCLACEIYRLFCQYPLNVISISVSEM